jgi:hydrophobic/amphiphilic exporter-1 (mainly G- bacteria), HAE1 family
VRPGMLVNPSHLLRNRREVFHVQVLYQPPHRRHGDFHRPRAGGDLTILSLPVAQFPSIAPPEVQILATYIGADAQTLEQAVATPIEQQMNGVDNMNYMYSLNATGNNSTSLIVDFDAKTDPNTDYILAQSRETLAASQLPVDVTNYGVTFESP